MLRWLGNALHSSIGRKIVMGLTGLLLVGFLIFHLCENLTLMPGLGDPSGGRFDSYVDFLWSFGGFLTVAEVALALLFLCHIYLGLRLTMENLAARREGYVVRNDRGAKTFASASMSITGALLLFFLIKHLVDFRFEHAFHEAHAATVFSTFASPGNVLIYVGAALIVGVHVSHGFQSAFQSIGWNHPRWTPLVAIVGRVIAVVLALGFASIPLYFLLFH